MTRQLYHHCGQPLQASGRDFGGHYTEVYRDPACNCIITHCPGCGTILRPSDCAAVAPPGPVAPTIPPEIADALSRLRLLLGHWSAISDEERNAKNEAHCLLATMRR